MRIQSNMAAINTANSLKKNQKATQSNLAKLSSGYSINKAADNAAGLAVSEKMRSQIRGLKQASKNATDGVNLIQTAEGYMKTATDILQRMRELAVQSANGTYDTGVSGQNAYGTTAGANVAQGNRAKINEEIQQLTDELDRLSKSANFNGMSLSGSAFAFQVGANTKTTYTSYATNASATVQVDTLSASQTSAGAQGDITGTIAAWTSSNNLDTGFHLVDEAGNTMQASTAQTAYAATGGQKNAETITAFIGAFDSKSLHVKAGNGDGTDELTGQVADTGVATDTGIDLTTQAKANKSIDTIDAAISQVQSYRAQLGAVQNRLEYTIDNLATSIENTTASESAIRDTDMVDEMMSYTKNNVLSQAATAMMAQANTQTQSVLQLLQ